MAAIPRLQSMAPSYSATMEDQETHSLSVSDEATTVSREVYGAWFAAQKHEEVKEFLAIWQLLKTAVRSHLPADVFIFSRVTQRKLNGLPPRRKPIRIKKTSAIS